MNKKILLIEDDKNVRENTSEILELANYSVKTAENGKTGISIANSFLPDIIICDIKMPVLDGYGVLQIISKNQKLKHIPFIFLSAKTHYDDLRKGMEFGADDYICKPFEESELLRAIESRLKRAKVLKNKGSFNTRNELELFDNFKNIKDLKQLLEGKKLFNYKKNETIYCEGNRSNFIFLVKNGCVKTYKNNELGKELITGYYSENQFFGYSSFVKQLPHFENSKTITATQLYKLTKEEIKLIMDSNPDVLFSLIELLSSKLEESRKRSLLLAYSSVRKKTATILLHLLTEYPDKSKNEISINRSDLASTIGIAKETLIRTLHDFKEEKLIDLKPRSIKILNKNKLQNIH
ncbi:response regulator [Lutibacter citreus]|uniref:response regulator n=1 Tax=Lutibacter citreus TaxID=2138210 RepID=UPI0015CFDDAA|nr:response regulator [Lutibacter citreus]